MNICVTGSLAFDFIMDFPGKFADNIMPDKIHKLNLSFLLSDLKKQRGGTAGNIAYNLALLKTPVLIFAAAGDDFDSYLNFLKEAGIDTQNIKIVDKRTASAFIMTDQDDNQITGFYPGAMENSADFSLKELKKKPDFLIISPNDPTAIEKLANEAREMNIPFMIDMGMQLPRLNPEQIKTIIKDSEILIGNDYEIDLLCQKSKLTPKDLLNKAKIIIITLGAKGSTIKTHNKEINIESAKSLEVVDPTGAGDAYRGGFMAGYSRSLDLKTCGQMGSVTACYAIEKYGTTTHHFTKAEFINRYRENFGEEIIL